MAKMSAASSCKTQICFSISYRMQLRLCCFKELLVFHVSNISNSCIYYTTIVSICLARCLHFNVLTLLLVGGPLWLFQSVPQTSALAPWNLGTFLNHSLGVLCQTFLLSTLRRGGSRAIFAEVLFAKLRVFRHFPSISALLRLAIVIDDIHRNSYALTTMWRHLVMLMEPPMLA